MKYIDITLPTPSDKLALHEALLDLCEAGLEGEILRFWEARSHFIVIGYANQAAREANLPACQTHGIPVFRRCSGGGTVLQGPGCLSYSLILKIQETGPTRGISSSNSFILQRHLAALAPLLKSPIRTEGHTDLALGNLKFSGNAQRRKRHFLIFHGTFLLQFDLPLIEKFLRMPSQQPDYRQARPHSEFLTNLNLPPDILKSALRQTWEAHDSLPDLPLANLSDLARKYSTDEWNFKF